jgi:NAD(P)-dependent dehydrogenase (short-subunit alcohol dehydrogenase family)
MDAPETEASSDLSGQVAIVTGGGNGLGRAVALRLVAGGARVAVVSRTAEQLDETVALIEASGGSALAVPADITDPEAVERTVRAVESGLGPIDLLVNNAGIAGPVAPFWEADPSDWWRAVEINVRGTSLCCAAVLPGLVERRRGRIVNMTSNAGIFRWPYLSAYAISKAAVIKLTENVAVEAKKHGVKLFALNPGMLRAGMTQSLLDAPVPPDSKVALVAAWFERELDAGAEVSLEDGAEFVALLASGRADALSGRYFSVYEDFDAIVARAGEIRRGDLYTLRLRDANTAP